MRLRWLRKRRKSEVVDYPDLKIPPAEEGDLLVFFIHYPEATKSKEV